MKKSFCLVLVTLLSLLTFTGLAFAGAVVVEQRFYAETNDGFLRKFSSDWSTTRNATAAYEVHSSNVYGYLAAMQEGNYYSLYWYSCMFDTSVIPSSASIITARLFTKIGTDGYGQGANYVVVQSSQGTWNNLTLEDYDQRGNTEGSSRFTVFPTNSYHEWPLNENGRSWVAKSGENKPATASSPGKTQLAIRNANYDIDNAVPPLVNNWLHILTAEQTGTANDPYLLVKYVCDATIAPSVGGNVISVIAVPPADYNNDENVNIDDIKKYRDEQEVLFKIWLEYWADLAAF